MKEQLEKELLSSLETVKDYLSKTAEFASEQAPIVIEELVRFNLWYSGLLVLGCFFVVVVIPMVVLAATVKHYKAKGDKDIFLFSLVPIILGLIIGLKEFKTLIMCLTAPGLFVIEYLRGML